ncbi:MAG: HlyD family efflux transporter periplasmic adaptor subunit [Xanthomonadales bacterium]|nr:HlyD family efflux transporter periplasmic adaptor subunit [Xanthomonadales bacterium]MCC6596232.1 HlyD family efflux transporter periplasmic adaptor subunit [Rhodanobacteraceae bacterium]MCW5579032.1 HlyD family efflux transporter periplasmic adaptor subunit [Dokdonella sp.]MDL1868363.1 HlyD family efflux transporter periplasmic adaptor subunit [Gammaproteobacteria bacterium PRO6]
MDIARPELKLRKRRRQWLLAGTLLTAVIGAAIVLARLGPALPSIERGSVLMDTVKRGELLREVRGPGTLVPRQIRWIAADTAAHVERIVVKPGAAVQADTVILELSNPEVDDQLLAAKAAVTAAQSDLAAKRTELKSRLLDEQAALAGANADYATSRIQAEAEKPLAEKGIIPGVQYRKTLITLEQLKGRVSIEQQRVEEYQRNIAAQIAAEQARLDQLIATRELRQRQADALHVRAGIAGILQQVPVEEGQQVAAGANLARVARPDELMAELRIAETQAKDITLGQAVRVDTRNGIVDGKVVRVDPAVQNGSVQVDVAFDGALPPGARPDLSVDGTIEIERLPDVLYVGRPAFGQAGSDARLFRVDADGIATRVPVRLGKSSVNQIQVVQGLQAGDRVILSDTSAWDGHDRLRLR